MAFMGDDPQLYVAPLAGSVDRNYRLAMKAKNEVASLPSRGAWIEIIVLTLAWKVRAGRSPRGERG